MAPCVRGIVIVGLFLVLTCCGQSVWIGPSERASAMIALGASLALFRLKVGVIPVIGMCAVIGLMLKWFRMGGVS